MQCYQDAYALQAVAEYYQGIIVLRLLSSYTDRGKIEMLLEQCQINRRRLQRILSQYGLDEKFREFEEKGYGK